MGFTRNEVTSVPRGLLHLGSILACAARKRPSAVHFCGTILRLAPTGRYPAPCLVEPGLSSRGVFTRAGDCLSNFPINIVYYTDLPPAVQVVNKRKLEKSKRLRVHLRSMHSGTVLMLSQLARDPLGYFHLHNLLCIVSRINQRNAR